MDDTTPSPQYGGFRLASHVQLVREGPCWAMLIDGERFPYLLDRIVNASLDTDEVPSVTVTLLADHVEIHDRDRRRGEPPSSAVFPFRSMSYAAAPPPAPPEVAE